MKKTIFILISSIYILIANAHAIGISPPGIEAGTLDLATPDTFLFEIKNLNNIPYTLNLTFEMTPGSNYLEPYITFTPTAMQITPQDKKTNFTITIASGIPSGNHQLVFIPRIEFIEPEPQMNDTGNINTAGTILSTSAAYIDFTIPEVPPPPPPPPADPPGGGGGGGAASADVPIASEEEPNMTKVPKKIINLTIEAPLHVKAVEPAVTVTIKLKNTGEITLKNLTLNMTATPSLDLEYNKQIGTLYPNQQKAINVKLSNFAGTGHFIEILVSDSETQKKWTANYTVHVPDEPGGTISRDCIEYTPENFKVTPNKKSQIELNIKNKCNISIHNLNTIMTTLGYSEVTGTLDVDETRTISIDVLLPPGISDHKLVFTYAEGKTTGHITIDAAVSFMTLILKAIASILLFILLVAILYLLYAYKKNRKKTSKPKPLLPPDIMQKIEKLKEEVKYIDDEISKQSEKETALKSKIFERRQELDSLERTDEQLKMCLENVKESIKYKKELLESSTDRDILQKEARTKLLNKELKQLEYSIKAKRALLDSLISIKKSYHQHETSPKHSGFYYNLKLHIKKIYLAYRHPKTERPAEKEDQNLLKHHIEPDLKKSSESKISIDTHAKRQASEPRIEEPGYKTILNHLRSYIRNIFKLHKDSKKEQLHEKHPDDSAKYRIEPNLEKPMDHETKPPDTLTQKDTYPKEEKISENLLEQLKSSIEQEQNTLSSLKTDEDLIDNPVFKEKILERNFNELQSVLGEEKELLRTLRTEEESVHVKSKTYRESLVGYQNELAGLSNVKNVSLLQDKKKSAQDVLLALDRLYTHNIIGKDVYESHRFVELELNSIDKIISKKLKEDAIKEPGQIPQKKKPRKLHKMRPNRYKAKKP